MLAFNSDEWLLKDLGIDAVSGTGGTQNCLRVGAVPRDRRFGICLSKGLRTESLVANLLRKPIWRK